MTHHKDAYFHTLRLLVCVLALSWPFPSYSENTSLGLCETVWSEFVDQVEEVLLPSWPETAIIFVDRDLNAFDCIGQDVNPDFLEYLSTALPPILRVPEDMVLEPNGSNLPNYFCVITSFSAPPYEFVSVMLPTDSEVLRVGLCQARLDASMNFRLERE